MSPTIVNKKVALQFALEYEKSYETLVPRVSPQPKNIRLDVHLFLMFSYHDETLELVFHVLLDKHTLIGKNRP